MNIFLVIILVISSTNLESKKQCNDNFLNREEIFLSGESEPIGTVTSVDLLPDGKIVAATSDPAEVILLTASGDRLRRIGRAGPGPFEYGSPSIVRTDSSRIAIWDESSLKLITFSHTGSALNEWTDFSSAIADFDISEDELFVYRSGGTQEGYLSGYDISGKNAKLNLEKEEASIEHIILMMLEGSGTVYTRKDSVYFGSPSRPYIYSYHNSGSKGKTYTIPDGMFNVESSGFSNISDINSNQRETVEFATSNSRLYKIIALHNGFLAALQHGSVHQGKNLIIQDYNRYINIHYLPRNGANLCERIDLDRRTTGDDPIVGYGKHGFLLLRTEGYDRGDFKYSLTKVTIPPRLR